HLEQVIGQDQIEHRETKQGQKQEEPPEAAPPVQMAVLGGDLVVFHNRRELVGHVADRKQVDDRGNEGHHQEHDGGQAIDAIAETQVHRRSPDRLGEGGTGDAAAPGVFGADGGGAGAVFSGSGGGVQRAGG